MKYEITGSQKQRLEKNFTYYEMINDQQIRYELLRAKFSVLTELIMTNTPDSR